MRRGFGAAQTVLFVYAVVYLSWLVTRWGPHGDRKVIGDLFQLGIAVMLALLCAGAARRCAGTPLRSVWWLITAAAVVGTVFGNVSQLYYEGVLGKQGLSSLENVFWLCGYVLFIAALLRFPTVRAGRVQRLQLTLDASVLAIGGALVMWYVEIGPAVTRSSSQPLPAEVFSVLFTICDLIVVAVVACVLTRGTIRSSARALRLFAGGGLGLVSADVLYGYVTVRLHQTYAGGDWIDGVFFAAILLWALSATSQRKPEPGELQQLQTTPLLRRRPSWAPYAAVATVLGLTIYAERNEAFFPGLSLVIGSVLLVALVAARQLAAQSELLDVQRQLQVAHDELAALATTDALTGLPNHRALVAAIDSELERSQRSVRGFALAFLDLDHFKALNDTLGHAAGDNALREIAQIIKSSLRASDSAGRWGGEEFVVLMPEADSGGALEAAERIRATVSQHRYQSVNGAHLTCSIGVAVAPVDGRDRDALVASADRAMYAAKQLGRNQVIAASDNAAAALAADAISSSREQQGLLGAVDALAAVVNARDSYTAVHSAAVAGLAQRVALTLGCDANQTHLIGLAARLHDIGKVAIPEAILNKPGPLTDEEWQLVQQHPGIGAEIAGRIPILRTATPLIRAHHERYDGTGYPDQLAGEAIPLGARIIQAADAYDAILTNRPYAPGRPCAVALAELRRCAGTQFDPRVIEALAHVIADDQTKRLAA